MQVRLSAGPINYRDTGSGPPLVFVHGLLANGTLWRKVVPELEGQARCIVPDWPFGSHPEPMNENADVSPRGLARLIDEFLAALDLDDVTLVANDTGGAVSQLLVTDRPQRIGRLVLTPCDAFDNFPPGPFKLLTALARTPPLLTGALQSMRVRALRRLPIAFGWLAKRPIPNEITDGWLDPYLENPAIRRDTVKLLRAVDKRDTLAAAERLREFDRPTLIVWAREDRVFPLDHGRRLADLFPNARLELIDDSYTFVPEDQPARLAALIGQFLREREGQQAGSRDGAG